MRAPSILAIAAILLVPASLSNAAPAGPVLDGWKGFKFGMTQEQARALPPPGRPWTSLAIPGASDVSNLSSLGPVKEFGASFDVVGLTFAAGHGLLIASLSAHGKTSPEDCRKSYLTLLPQVEARYGSFAALGFGLPPGGTVSVQDLPGAKSQYRLFHTRDGFRMDAVRTFGTRYISVRTSYVTTTDGGTCFTDVWFQQPEPSEH